MNNYILPFRLQGLTFYWTVRKDYRLNTIGLLNGSIKFRFQPIDETPRMIRDFVSFSLWVSFVLLFTSHRPVGYRLVSEFQL